RVMDMEKWSQQQIEVYKRSVDQGTQEIEEYESSIVFHQNKIKGIQNKLERARYKKTRELSQLSKQGWTLTEEGWKEREGIEQNEFIKRIEAIKAESLREGNGVIVHVDNFGWIMETIISLSSDETK
ncbi:TPA: hypothetical protein SAS01_005552, partial [Bacillus cereus]|nr:hypothetical protein [Bacillus cereus]